MVLTSAWAGCNAGYFWVAKFGKYFFGWPDLSRDFFGDSEHDSARVSFCNLNTTNFVFLSGDF